MARSKSPCWRRPAEATGLDRLRAGRDRSLALLGEAPLAAVVAAHQRERGKSQRAGRDQRRRTQRNPFHRTRPGNASASCRTPARRCAELVNLLLSRGTINQSLTLCFAREWTCVVMARHRRRGDNDDQSYNRVGAKREFVDT